MFKIQNRSVLVFSVLLGFVGLFTIGLVIGDRNRPIVTGSVPVDDTDASDQDFVYDDAETNLELWLDRLEVNNREVYRERAGVVAAADIQQGDVVIDFASGTGFFTLMFAKAVGGEGHVYAIDIAARFLELLRTRAVDEDLTNISPVLAQPSSIPLHAGTADLVFISSAYHEFDDRFQAIGSAYNALKSGGRLLIVDFKDLPENANDPLKSHVAFGKAQVIAEVETAGFAFVGDKIVDGFDENYLIVFKKP